ncbi:phosphohistidine phosphatase SixA [Natronocella acetinitrilica]|uniref:Phosphohistidine phosphatase SixA n=1 Tax=Natronocella acetinitrilica TaxID=414046 RepID=A0AAE3G8Q4_9GAMM|nr:histidine phosphatase family protein [Natronocella acetinitrilica]MCP1677093.1 phosphohistidine phosphatase SixA [Natronocella acetinitrilica]
MRQRDCRVPWRWCLMLLPALFLCGPAKAGNTSEELIEALRAGGLVVYLRHADTTGEPRDATMDLADRSRQRNLSAAGRDQARRIGEAVERLGVPVATVETSPVFRARDTAELAFGEARTQVNEMLTADDYVRGSYAAYAAYLRERFSTPPEEGNTWLVGHIVPLSIALGEGITRQTFGEGAAAVFDPLGEQEGYRLIGILAAGWEEAD